MFKKFIGWITGKTNAEALAALREDAEQMRHVIEQLRQEAASKDAELRLQRERSAEDEARYESTDPWVEIKSESVHPVRGIEIKLDWNDAFIQYLQDNGIKGRDEDEIVQRWLSLLYADLASKFEQRAADNTEFHRVNDFE